MAYTHIICPYEIVVSEARPWLHMRSYLWLDGLRLLSTRFSSSYVTLVECLIHWRKIWFYFLEELFMKIIEKVYWELLKRYIENYWVSIWVTIYEGVIWMSFNLWKILRRHRVIVLLLPAITFSDRMIAKLFSLFKNK